MDDKDYKFKDTPLLRDGITSMPPGRTIPLLFDSFFGRGEEFHADEYRVEITYQGPNGEYRDDVLLDLGAYRNIQFIKRKTVDDMGKDLETIAKAVKDWTKWSSRGSALRIWTTEDQRIEQKEMDEFMKQERREREGNDEPPENTPA